MKIIFKKQAIAISKRIKKDLTNLLTSHGIKPKEKELIKIEKAIYKNLGGKTK